MNKLLGALDHESLPAIMAAINAGTKDVNATNRYGYTALHFAVLLGKVETVKELIAKQADVNVHNQTGQTPLHIACHYGHLASAILLVNNSAKIYAFSAEGFTPLHMACKQGYTELAEFLVDKGASVHVKDNNEMTPIDITTSGEIIRLLLNHGAPYKDNDKINNAIEEGITIGI